MDKRQFLISTLALAYARIGAAQDFPSRPIKLVNAFTAGSSSDLVARIVATQMAKDIKQPVIVDNRPGAGGAIAAAFVAKAPADGYTVLVHSASFVTAPWIYKKLPYDPKDLIGLASLGALSGVVVAPAGKYKTLARMIEEGRKPGDGLNFASAGFGSSTHMAAEKLNMVAKLNATHVPFVGTPEALTDVAAGRCDYFVAPINTALAMVKAGRVDALAISADKRNPALPNVPTVDEAGAVGSAYPFWTPTLVSARTPPDIVAFLHQSISQAMAHPETLRQLAENGIDPFQMGQKQLDDFIKKEIDFSGELTKRAKILPQ